MLQVHIITCPFYSLRELVHHLILAHYHQTKSIAEADGNGIDIQGITEDSRTDHVRKIIPL